MSSIVPAYDECVEGNECVERIITSFPDEIMLLVFSFIGINTTISLPYVCKRWRTICYTLPLELNIHRLLHNTVTRVSIFDIFATVDYFNCIKSLTFNTETLSHLDRIPSGGGLKHVPKLSYYGNKYDRREIGIVRLLFQFFRSLTAIKVESSIFNCVDLREILLSNNKITSINLWQTNVDIRDLTVLIQSGLLRSLKKLKFSSYNFKSYRYTDKHVCDLFFQAISIHCPEIEWLDVRNSGITVTGLMALKECVKLFHLNVAKSHCLTKKHIKGLNKERPDMKIILR